MNRSDWSRSYGAPGWHLALMMTSLAVIGYVVATVGPSALWDPDVWWQSILVWFAASVILHDLVLFPAYAAVDRLLLRTRQSPRTTPGGSALGVEPVNYVRVPLLASGLMFLLFFPGILRRGSSTFADATGLDQDPFLQRWILLTAAAFLASGALYVVALLRARRGARRVSRATAPSRSPADPRPGAPQR